MALSVFDNEEMRKEAVSYLQEEITKAENEREGKMQRIQTYRRQREAIPAQETKNWPWEKASNVCVPLALINTNGTFGVIKSTFANPKKFVSISTKRTDLEKHAEALTEFFSILYYSAEYIDINTVNNTIFYDVGSLGTQFVRVPWIFDRFSFKRMGPDGEMEVVTIVEKDSPGIRPFRIEDVITRAHVSNLQKATWVATISHLSEHELLQKKAHLIYENVDDMLDFFENSVDEAMERSLMDKGLDPQNTKIYDIYEVNLFWDVDGDGLMEDIKIWFERWSGTVLREEYNDLGMRDIVRIPFLHVPYELYGLGVGQMVNHLQDEVDTLHNMRIDSTLLSLLQMFVTRRGSLMPGDEDVYPGKIWEVDDVKNLLPLKFYDVGPSSMSAEMLAREYASQATNVGNAMMGQPDVYARTRSTASGYMAQMQQGLTQFTSSVVENLKAAYSEIALLVMLQLIKNKDKVFKMLSQLDAEKRGLVAEILNSDIENIRNNFVFEIRTTEVEQSEEAKRQARLTLVQLYNMYGQQMLQLAGMMQQVPPNSPLFTFITKFITGATKLMDEVFEDFGKKDEKAYLPYVKDIEMMNNVIEAMKQQQLGGMMRGQSTNAGMGNEVFGATPGGGPAI